MRTVSLGINVSEQDGTDYQSEGFDIQVPDEMSTGEIIRKFVEKIEIIKKGELKEGEK